MLWKSLLVVFGALFILDLIISVIILAAIMLWAKPNLRFNDDEETTY